MDKILQAYEEMLNERGPTQFYGGKEDKPLAKSKLAWAFQRYKDIKKWVEGLESEIASGDKNAMRASIGTIKSLIDVVERGLDL